MASKVHLITSYHYQFDSRQGTVGVLNLFGPITLVPDRSTHRLMIHFVADTEPLPPPDMADDLEFAQCSFRLSAFPGLLDMLRNEDPIGVTLDEGHGWVFVSTQLEPVGIGDEAAQMGTGSTSA
jgi:hypothetical protein